MPYAKVVEKIKVTQKKNVTRKMSIQQYIFGLYAPKTLSLDLIRFLN